MISVDPGTGGTGYAVWKGNQLKNYGTIHFHSNCETWEQKMKDIGLKFLDMLRDNKPAHTIVMESPVFMRGTGGYMVASAGDLCKLAMLTGHLAARVYDRFIGTQLTLVEPSKWKGQLPKNVVARRVQNLIPSIDFKSLRISNHAMDAIGIGLWRIGVL